MKHEYNAKTSEVEAMKAKINELEQLVLKKESALGDYKRQVKQQMDEYTEEMKNQEAAYEVLKVNHMQLEGRIMELNDTLAKSMRQRQRPGTMTSRTPSNQSLVASGRTSGSAGGAAAAPPRRGLHASASVDIELPATLIPGTSGTVDK